MFIIFLFVLLSSSFFVFNNNVLAPFPQVLQAILDGNLPPDVQMPQAAATSSPAGGLRSMGSVRGSFSSQQNNVCCLAGVFVAFFFFVFVFVCLFVCLFVCCLVCFVCCFVYFVCFYSFACLKKLLFPASANQPSLSITTGHICSPSTWSLHVAPRFSTALSTFVSIVFSKTLLFHEIDGHDEF